MFRFLDILRQKPEEIRRRYALGASVVIVLIIAIVWGITLPARLRDAERTNALDVEPAPLGSLVKNIREGFAAVKQSFLNNPFMPVSTSTVMVQDIASSTSTTSDSFSRVIITDPE